MLLSCSLISKENYNVSKGETMKCILSNSWDCTEIGVCMKICTEKLYFPQSQYKGCVWLQIAFCSY